MTIDKKHIIIDIALSALGVIALAVLLGITWSKNGEPPNSESNLVGFFFAAPLVAQGFCLGFLLFKLDKQELGRWCYYFNLATTFICLLCCCVLWILYLNPANNGMGGSYWALGLILVLLCAVAMLTFALKRTSQDLPAWCQDLRTGILNHPSCAMMLFLTLFLGVAYLFAFALAFHDRHAMSVSNNKRPALHMVNHPSIDDQSVPPSNLTQTPSPQPSPGTSSQPVASVDDDEGFRFYFNSLSDKPRMEKDDRCDLKNRPLGPNDKVIYRGVPIKIGQKGITTEISNYCNLEYLSERINRETEGDKRVRITLIGSADEKPAGGGQYNSNYELSAGRTEQVKLAIMKKFGKNLRWYNIEWLSVASPSELTPQPGEPNLSGQEKRVVLVSIDQNPEHITKHITTHITATMEPILERIKTIQTVQATQSSFRPLKLMDYLYFSIYTITTTGHGDIVPTTAYAKFVASLANICEVIFLVVFFNTVLSLKRERDPNKTDTGTAPRGEPGQADPGLSLKKEGNRSSTDTKTTQQDEPAQATTGQQTGQT